MISVFLHSLSRYRGQILGWGLGLALLGFYLVGFYDTIAAEQETYTRLIENFPKEMMAFFGDFTEMATPQGYLGIEFFSYMPLILGIFAVMAGSGLLASDEEAGTLELVIAHPISRTALFVSRLLAFITAAASILILTWLSFVLGKQSSSMDVTVGELARPFIELFAMLMLFGGLALLLSMLLPSRGMAAMISGLLLVASFFITSLQRIDPDLEPLARFSPLTYYLGGDAILGLNGEWLAGLVGFALLFMLAGWFFFQRRDLRVSGEGAWQLPGLARLRRANRRVS
jgi:ABC-2 type transport system permease protein